MIANNHFYTKNQVGINPDPFKDILTLLLNISFDNDRNQIEFQTFRTDDGLHPPANYTIPNNEQGNPAWTQPASGAGKFPQFIVENNIMQQAFGINQGTYPTSQTDNNTLTLQTFHSTTNAGLQLKYSKLYYKPSNYQFANQGAVSAGDLITRRRYNTITDAAATYTNALGLSVANALAYGVPANGYTIKDKLGYPLKKTPTFNKYSDDMQKCTPTTFANIM
jgi:hypothetical protein